MELLTGGLYRTHETGGEIPRLAWSIVNAGGQPTHLRPREANAGLDRAPGSWTKEGWGVWRAMRPLEFVPACDTCIIPVKGEGSQAEQTMPSRKGDEPQSDRQSDTAENTRSLACQSP